LTYDLGSNNNSQQQQQQQQKIFYVSVPVSALLFPLTHMPPFVTVSRAWLVHRLYRHRLLGLPKRILRLQGTCNTNYQHRSSIPHFSFYHQASDRLLGMFRILVRICVPQIAILLLGFIVQYLRNTSS
jgi:hypothetical protein